MKWLVYLSKFIVLWSSGTQWCWQATEHSIIVAAYMYKYIWTTVYCTVLQHFYSDSAPYKCLPLGEVGTFVAPLGGVTSDWA